MNFKTLNEATLHCLSLPNNKKVKDLLLHYFDVDNLNKIETVATIKATHENITENQFVFRHCYKLGGDNYSYIECTPP